MSMRYLLGITQRITINDKTGERRDALAQNWYDFLSELGVGWIALPNRPREALCLAERTNVRGVILTGGDDIGVFPERDETEMALLEWCRSSSRPLVGVCRGFQMLHHWLGGDLVRVNPSVHVSARHSIRKNREGEREERKVNSFHNFAPDFSSLPVNYPLRMLYYCPFDNMVEAAMSELFLGIMWHPEREEISARVDVMLFKEHFAI